MKRRYMTPEVQTVSVHLTTMIADSNAVTTNLPTETPVSYGGVDEDGELDPAARRYDSIWGED